MDWLDGKFLISIFTAIFTGGVAWGWARRDRQALSKDILKNDERLRTEINQQMDRDKERFVRVEKDIELLEGHRLQADTRLTKIESDSAHTRKAVDEMSSDVKEIMKQLTAVATTMATRREK